MLMHFVLAYPLTLILFSCFMSFFTCNIIRMDINAVSFSSTNVKFCLLHTLALLLFVNYFLLTFRLSISFQYFLGLYKLRDTRHIAISGPSGCGKSTIIKKLVNSSPQYKFSVSHTSRPMRKGEVHGVDYFFVSKDKFIRMIKNGEFLEYAMYNNNYYGTSTSQFEDQNRIIVLDLERQGIEHLKGIENQFRFIFLYCSKEELLKRLVKRQTVDIEKLHEISNRLAEADADHKVFDKGIYDIGVENNDIDDTLEMINNFLNQDKSK